MVALFISHSSRDEREAARLCEWLAASGLAGLFLSSDPVRGIPGGRSWERELYSQLRKSDAVVFLASRSSVASRWCFAELCLARSMGKRIFPLRLEREVTLNLLADTQWIGAGDGGSATADLLGALRSAGLDPRDSFAWDPRRAPYPGLEAFSGDDAAVFFGRDREIEELEELLQPILRRHAGRCVGIVGASGSGKSSLLHAGLLPRLRRHTERWLILPPLVPGRRPITQLARSLAEASTRSGHPGRAEDLESELRKGPAVLGELARRLSDSQPRQPNVLLVVDQAEELTTLAGADEQRKFLDLLRGVVADEGPLWVVLAARSDFLVSDPKRAGLAEIMHGVVVVEPLSRHRLPEVIRRPAQQAGIDFASGLVEQMTDETQGGDALGLLAYTLRALYELPERQERITAADYAAVGGVVGALQRRADRLVGELAAEGRGDDIMPTLLQLVTVDRDSEPTRRRTMAGELSDESKVVVAAFTEARLFVAGVDATGQSTIEVAHEALLRQWDPLRETIKASRASLRTRADLERLAADWARARQDESYLLRGARLADVDDWATEHPEELHSLERRYLEASRSATSRELTQTRRSNRRLRFLAVGLSSLLVMTVIATLAALRLNDTARSEARTNLARQLAAQSDRLVEGQPETAILLGLQSLSVAHSGDSEPQPPAGLITGLSRHTHASVQLAGHRGEVSSVVFAPDGTTVASASQDGTVRRWTTAGEPHMQPLEAHTGDLSGVAFSKDGQYLGAAGEDGVVRLWQLPALRELPPLYGHVGPVYGIAFSPDARLLATAGEDGHIRLWDVPSFQPHSAPLSEHTDAVYRLAFSPDGSRLASASWDGTARIWNTSSGEPIGPALEHDDQVQSVAFSPDGRLLASGGVDQLVRLWDVQSGQQLDPPMSGGDGEVHGVAFSPDGKLLATTGTDGAVQLWDAATHRAHGLNLIGHTGATRDVAFSPDGTLLVSASWDRTARIWKVAGTPSISRALVAHTDELTDVAFSPDGELLATASADDTVLVWNRNSGQPEGPPLIGHTDDVTSVAFSPDDNLLATGSADNTVRLWDLRTRQPRGPPLNGHTSWINDIAFSPNGELLASASEDYSVRLWAVASGRPYRDPLGGHTQGVFKVCFSPNGELIATAGVDRTVRLWDAATGLPHGAPLSGHTDWVTTVAFNPIGGSLASGSRDGTIRIWNLESPDLIGDPIEAPAGEVTDIAFNRDGRRLASAGIDQAIRIWDPDSGRALGQPLTGHTGAIRALAFNPRDDTIATASDDRIARLWNPDFDEWVTYGCDIVGRNLAGSDWKQFLGDRPYERTCPALPPGAGAPANAPADPTDPGFTGQVS